MVDVSYHDEVEMWLLRHFKLNFKIVCSYINILMC